MSSSFSMRPLVVIKCSAFYAQNNGATFLASAPPLAWSRELVALGEHFLSDHGVPKDTCEVMTTKELSQAIDRHPAVAHIMGHMNIPTSSGGPTLDVAQSGAESTKAKADRPPGPEIAAMIMTNYSRHGPIRAVVLSGCYSFDFLLTLRDMGLGFGVCWLTAVENQGAASFARGFYTSLAEAFALHEGATKAATPPGMAAAVARPWARRAEPPRLTERLFAGPSRTSSPTDSMGSASAQPDETEDFDSVGGSRTHSVSAAGASTGPVHGVDRHWPSTSALVLAFVKGVEAVLRDGHLFGDPDGKRWPEGNQHLVECFLRQFAPELCHVQKARFAARQEAIAKVEGTAEEEEVRRMNPFVGVPWALFDGRDLPADFPLAHRDKLATAGTFGPFCILGDERMREAMGHAVIAAGSVPAGRASMPFDDVASARRWAAIVAGLPSVCSSRKAHVRAYDEQWNVERLLRTSSASTVGLRTPQLGGAHRAVPGGQLPAGHPAAEPGAGAAGMPSARPRDTYHASASSSSSLASAVLGAEGGRRHPADPSSAHRTLHPRPPPEYGSSSSGAAQLAASSAQAFAAGGFGAGHGPASNKRALQAGDAASPGDTHRSKRANLDPLHGSPFAPAGPRAQAGLRIPLQNRSAHVAARTPLPSNLANPRGVAKHMPSAGTLLHAERSRPELSVRLPLPSPELSGAPWAPAERAGGEVVLDGASLPLSGVPEADSLRFAHVIARSSARPRPFGPRGLSALQLLGQYPPPGPPSAEHASALAAALALAPSAQAAQFVCDGADADVEASMRHARAMAASSGAVSAPGPDTGGSSESDDAAGAAKPSGRMSSASGGSTPAATPARSLASERGPGRSSFAGSELSSAEASLRSESGRGPPPPPPPPISAAASGYGVAAVAASQAAATCQASELRSGRSLLVFGGTDAATGATVLEGGFPDSGPWPAAHDAVPGVVLCSRGAAKVAPAPDRVPELHRCANLVFDRGVLGEWYAPTGLAPPEEEPRAVKAVGRVAARMADPLACLARGRAAVAALPVGATAPVIVKGRSGGEATLDDGDWTSAGRRHAWTRPRAVGIVAGGSPASSFGGGGGSSSSVDVVLAWREPGHGLATASVPLPSLDVGLRGAVVMCEQPFAGPGLPAPSPVALWSLAASSGGGDELSGEGGSASAGPGAASRSRRAMNPMAVVDAAVCEPSAAETGRTATAGARITCPITVVGGEANGGGTGKSVFRLCPGEERWTKVSSLGRGRRDAQGVWVAELRTRLVTGGFDPSTRRPLLGGEQFDDRTSSKWTPIPRNSSVHRYMCAYALDTAGLRLYRFGGRGLESSTPFTMDFLDLRTMKWSPSDDRRMPKSTIGGAAVIDSANGVAYISGGDSTKWRTHRSLMAMSLASGVALAQRLPPMPTSRKHHGMLLL